MKRGISIFLTIAMVLTIIYQTQIQSLANNSVTGDDVLRIEDGKLIVSNIKQDTFFHTNQVFSGDYTVEMHARVRHQASGLLLGKGGDRAAMWSLATVAPNGVWIHSMDSWDCTRVPSDQVQNDMWVTLKVEIRGTTATTWLNGKQVNRCNIPEGSSNGPIGLRFAGTEAADLDYIKVYQDGKTIWEDDFNKIDGNKWDYAPSTEEIVGDIPESYMEPIWEGTTAYEESVWPVAEQDGTVKDIPLLYHADKIISVQNLARTETYQQGEDYILADGKLRIPKDSHIPVTSYDTYHPSTGMFSDKNGGYTYWEEGTGIVTRQIYVTYQHSDSWEGQKPVDKSNLLPKTMQRLENRQDLKIVFYGDSITEGYNTSGFVKTAPYMPKWSTLVTESLKKAYPFSNITEVNTGLSGKDTRWGVQNLSERVTAYNPDLVVLAFGMNDGGQLSSEEYVANLQTMIDGIHAKNPDCEIVLVSTTLPNPDVPEVQGYHAAYEAAMLAMEQEGIAVADMTAVHKALIEKKSFRNMTGNNVNHPNDYLARIYGQVVYQTAFGKQQNTLGNLTDVTYVNDSKDPYQTMDIQLPEQMLEPVPVLVFLHGGAWVIGDKTDEELSATIDAALADGYAVVRVNYRLAQNAKWPAQIYDCKAAIRFIRANAEKYNLNPDQIAVLGCSAGAHLAQMLGVTNGNTEFEDLSMGNKEVSSDVQAVVSMYGISDVSTWSQTKDLTNIIGNGKDPSTMLLGENYTAEQALAASPITYVSSKTVPMFIGHGKNDTLVGCEQSITLSEKLKENIDPELVDTYFPEDAPHAHHDAWNSKETVKAAMNFLQKRFRPEVNLDSDENRRPGYGNVDLSGYKNKYIGLQYASQSPTQKLHLVLPEGGEKPHKVIVFVHGGGFGGGNSAGNLVLYTAEGALRALERGYAVALVDYRCHPEGHFPEPVYDVKAAIRYLRANAEKYNLDSANIAIWGESAGGCIADFVGTTNGDPAYEDLSMGNAEYSSKVQAVVSWYAITDLATNRNAQYRPAWLGSNAGNMDIIKDSSPLNHVKKDAPAFYLQHGMADNEVEYQDSIRLYEALVGENGNPNTTLELFPGITHAVKKFLHESNATKIVDWLDKVLVFTDNPKEDDPIEKPSENNPATDNKPQTSTESSSTGATSPKTGDSTSIAGLIGMVLAGGVLAIKYRKKFE